MPRIGNDAAVQRHAVHRRGHAVLAHAVVDEAAGIIVGRHRLHRLGARVVRAGEVGRAADHLRHRRDQAFEREFAGRARRDVLRLSRRGFPSPRALRRRAPAAADRRACGARTRRAWRSSSAASRLFQSACAAFERAAGGAPGCQNVGRNFERRVRPAELFARALDLVGAERRAVRDALPALVGAPKPMVVLQAISTGLSDVLRLLERRGDRRRIVTVDARTRSSRRPRSASPGRRCRRATTRRRWKCRCRRTARSAC